MRALLTILALLLVAGPAQAQTTLEIGGAAAGGNRSSSAGYSLVGTAGQLQAIGVSVSGDSVEGGLWHLPSTDTDGDGWSDTLDCGPTDPTVSPSGVELPDDGIDQDCDGVDATECFTDIDGDGFGISVLLFALDGDCTDAGESLFDTDCDDGEASINPGASEIPDDGIDQDCSGTDTVTCYVDADGDGDGSTNTVLEPAGACTGANQSSTGTDCDDADTTIYLGATEIPDDAVDQDCDGFDTVTCLIDSDDDGYGSSSILLSSDGDCDEPGETAIAGDCNDGEASINPGATEIPDDGIDQDCNGTDAVTCYVDGDGDGDGTATTLVSPNGVCTGANQSSTDSDCDDTDASINPGATDVPDDGIDQDCSGADSVTCWSDLDGDGYGVGNLTEEEGVCPGGTAGQDGDCDETDPNVNPGADEICNDGLNDDCDAATDENGDTDGDHWTICEGDCDDAGPDTYPTAVELCDDPADSVDNDCDPATLEDPSDEDGDGVQVCAGDCDDDNLLVYPGALELCDDLDNDCDGSIETDQEIEVFYWYLDVDGDGYGDPSESHIDGPACDQPEDGFVPDGTDCDDADPAIHPDADELCDGIDNDCDPSTNLDGADADADGDGHRPCDPAPGSAERADCDDSDAAISPSAEEICDDLIDNNCDALIDKDDANCGRHSCTSCNAATAEPAAAESLLAGLLLLAAGLRRRRTGAHN